MKVRLGMIGFLAILAVALTDNPVHAVLDVDLVLPEYKAVEVESLDFVGSDTMKHEIELLTEGFRKFYPNVAIKIESKGSSSGPPALIEGRADFAPMSRAMKANEVDAFKKKYGYRPTALPTSIDMLAVYVHKDNPIKGLTLQQVDALFSKDRKGGALKAINTWGDLGATGEWADKKITFYGRNTISGTYRFFVEHALFNGAFREEVKELEDSAAVVEHIAKDKYAIGYSGIGFKTDDVRPLDLALDIKSEYFAPEPDNAYTGNYPLTRMLFLYVNHKPGTPLDPVRREFIRYLFSQQGQADVIRSGYLPLGNLIATRAMVSVELQLDPKTPDTKATAPAAKEVTPKPAAPTGKKAADTAVPAPSNTVASSMPAMASVKQSSTGSQPSNAVQQTAAPTNSANMSAAPASSSAPTPSSPSDPNTAAATTTTTTSATISAPVRNPTRVYSGGGILRHRRTYWP